MSIHHQNGESKSYHRNREFFKNDVENSSESMERDEIFYCFQCGTVFPRRESDSENGSPLCPVCSTKGDPQFVFVDFCGKRSSSPLFQVRGDGYKHLKKCKKEEVIKKDLMGGMEEDIYGEVYEKLHGITRELEMEWYANYDRHLTPTVDGVESFIKSLEVYKITNEKILSKIESETPFDALFHEIENRSYKSFLLNTLDDLGSFLLIKRSKLGKYFVDADFMYFFALLTFWDCISSVLKHPSLIDQRDDIKRLEI